MAVGLSGLIITFLLYDYENGFDSQHVDTENVFRVNTNRLIEGEIQKYGIVPSALGPIATAEDQSIKSFTRYTSTNAFLLQYEDIIHRERINFADPTFFDMFTFDLISGHVEVFEEKSTVIISEDFAKKYFGDSEPMGKQLTLRHNDDILHEFVVGAVVKKMPVNSSFRFNIIAQYENLLDFYQQEEFDWTTDLRPVLFIEAGKAASSDEISTALKKYRKLHNEIQDSWKISDFYLVPFKEQKEEARFVHSYSLQSGLPISALYGSLVMNMLILLIACFNFTNTSLAYANKRLKEIGIRRTFGGVRSQIIKQFFTENFILCLLALLLSIEIANTWIGWMNVQWPIDIPRFYFDDWSISINLLLLLILVSLIAGAYPSFYISKFHPTAILKGKLKLQGTNNFTRVLLIWQFGFSVMAIFSGVVLTQNALFQKNFDWGFDKENALIIPLQEEGQYETLKNELAKIETVQSIAGTIHNLGYGYQEANIEIDGKKHNSHQLFIGDQYLSTVGCQIVEGRDFLINSENDAAESILVNEYFVETYQIDKPLSQTVYIDQKAFHIVGVVEDFMPYGLYDPVKPSIINLAAENKYQQLVIRAEPANLKGILKEAQMSWKQLFPNKPFEGFFMEEAAFEAMHTNNGILVQFGIMGLFALFLSISGLYSTVSLTVNKRIKEIGIRKVLGASVSHVMGLLNVEFGIIISIAILIGCAGGYYFMDQFLSDIYTYYLDIGALSFLAASLTIVSFALLTSGVKIYKAAMSNPTDSLRYE